MNNSVLYLFRKNVLYLFGILINIMHVHKNVDICLVVINCVYRIAHLKFCHRS